MRIAVAGTHCSGKSTLVEALLRAYPDFNHEPEPYTVLVEDYGEEFSAEPTAQEFLRQLEFNCERLRDYAPGDRVIFERSPGDFLAYIMALLDLNREGKGSGVVDRARAFATPAFQHLDLIVYLPLDDIGIEVPDDEDPELRSAMDRRLGAILLDDAFGAFTSGVPQILKLGGSTADRMRMVEAAFAPSTPSSAA